MSQSVHSNTYFTRHLFRAGLECPTKLFYKANNYSESREALPFVAHNHYNKNQLRALVRCFHPQGIFIDAPSAGEAFSETAGSVRKHNVTLFDAVFVWQNILAKVPVIEKKGDLVNVYNIQTKAFNPNKHRLTNHRGNIHPKWVYYLTDMAFQLYVVQRLYPQWKLTPFLVLPDKGTTAGLNQLHEKLKANEHGIVHSDDIKAAGEDLLVKIDVGDLLTAIWNGGVFEQTSFAGKPFEQVVTELKGLYFSGTKYPVTVGSKCKNCEFRIESRSINSGETDGFEECWKQETGINSSASRKWTFDLIGPGTDKWLERGLYFQHQIPEEELTTIKNIEKTKGRITERQRQVLQILKAKGSYVPDEIIKPQLFDELKRWKFPIHFLDFEAGNYAIPIKSNRKPYHLVVFQYSCHSLQQDGSWQHYEWIDDSVDGYPNYEFIRRLRQIPRIKEGTVVQYSNFERNALKIIRKELRQEKDEVPDASELIEWIEHFITRHDSNGGKAPYLADLSRMVRNFYYNNQMGNSLSIKDVVQSVLTQSTYLKTAYRQPYNSSNFDSIIWWQQDEDQELVRNPYSILMDQQNETTVRRGTEAMVVYGKLLSETVSKSEKQDQIKALLKYCELDTLAMLMIYQHWQELLNSS